MPPRDRFVSKLLGRFDRIDRESAQSHLKFLAQENQLCWEILDSLNEGVVLLSKQGYLRWLNRTAERWLGLGGSLSGRALFVDRVEDVNLRAFLRQKLPGLKFRLTEEIQLLTPREMGLKITLLPISPSMSDGGIVVLMTDISEITGREREKSRMERIEALVSLAAGVAHELGNPLNSVGIHLQLLKSELEALPAASKERADKILSILSNETVRLDAIVKNFLRAARKPPLSFQYLDLNQVVRDAVELMRPQLELENIRLVLGLEPRPVNFLLAQDRLHQILLNLIKNAADAMRGRPDALLRIRVTRRNKVAVLRIQDNGCGIPLKDLPHIFDAYFTTKQEGSGLGLMSVYDSVNEHGGKIDVSSKPGKGTVFTIWLPMRLPALRLPAPAKETAQGKRSKPAPG